MALSNHEKTLIQTTFNQIAPQADAAAELFYKRLFEIAPDTKPLFANTDMQDQGGKLMQTIGLVVSEIDHLDTLIPAVEALGKRHIDYGVHKEQYAIVGQALIWTLEQALGHDFTDEVRLAWIKVYSTLAEAATRAYNVEPA